MSVDYLLSSLPRLDFEDAAPMTMAAFVERIAPLSLAELLAPWREIETELKNAAAEARGGAEDKRPTDRCSLFWRGRVTAAFAEKDVLKRQALIDRVFWDAAAELTPASAPLSRGALATYAARLEIACRRSTVSRERGNEIFDILTDSGK